MLQTSLQKNEKLVTRDDRFFSYTIRQKLNNELISMCTILHQKVHDDPFRSICLNAALHLFEIEKLYSNGDINPYIKLRTGQHDPVAPVSENTVRVGFYPVSANPFHWGHILIGLTAIARLKLDKIIYAIAGNDVRKPDLAPAAIRHPMAQDVLRCFEPLFEYSPVAYSTDNDGEKNLFSFLRLNAEQKIDVWYIAGADHYRKTYPGTRYPDTVQKIEEHVDSRLYGYNENRHEISLGFIERGVREDIVDTFLHTQFLPALPFKASSTMIRDALNHTGDRRALALLPYTAYVDILAFSLYGCRGDRMNIVKHDYTALPPAHGLLQSALAVCP